MYHTAYQGLHDILMQMMEGTHELFWRRQMENALRSARSGQPVREPTVSSAQLAQRRLCSSARPAARSARWPGSEATLPSASAALAQHPARTQRSANAGEASKPARPQTAPFKCVRAMDWERASAGSRAVCNLLVSNIIAACCAIIK